MAWADFKPQSIAPQTWDDLGSEYDTLRGDTVATSLPDTTATPSTGPSAAQQWLGLLRTAVLAGSALTGATAAALGTALISYLLVARALTPPHDIFSRPLQLDYSQADLAGVAVFLAPSLQLADGVLPPDLPPSARFLQPRQVVDIWVELQVPQPSSSSSGACGPNTGAIMQVVAELQSADGRVAARASKPARLSGSWAGGWAVWRLATAPLRWVGLLEDVRSVRVPLLTRYREKEDPPFALLRVAVKSRGGAFAPDVLAATAKVQLRMGLLRRALYLLRPGSLLMLMLAGGALSLVLGGGTAALLLGGYLLAAMGAAAGRGGGAGGLQEDEGLGAEDADDDLGSDSGVSDVSSDILREEGSSEPPSPRDVPVPAPARWHDTLSELGSSASGSGVARSPRSTLLPLQQHKGGEGGGLPAVDDSAKGSTHGVVGTAASLLRRRPS